MFKQPVKSFVTRNNISVFRQNVRFGSTETEKKKKWDLFSAVCLERHPVITKPMLELESKFHKILREIEFENSMKCDHELRLEAERKQVELQKKGLLDVDLDVAIKQSAQDIEDSGEAELAAFKFAPRVTEADEKNIKTSLDRKLDSCLVLLVQQKLGDELFWLPPQACRVEGESMRQTADRVMKEFCGDGLQARIYGNAPIGFYKYAYPKPMRESGRYGAKVFYYLGRYLNGSIPETVKHQWLDRKELEETMPEPVHKSVSMFLIKE
ncbi:39S ribosomal protein L46, mitochondrial isoform X2 [Venturia canescens]|uniref:39S ribosomal protein L46, mitochondrial isoform X2 n=1 Tax=Venturia canescens TaxID=32260 RepID=UPI001C9C9917|nr:39S ribosomal protein L46, mitochondrial isoform X2 [Venturia canescens]